MNIVAYIKHYPDLYCAGAETYLHQTLRWLFRRGHKVSVITSTPMLGGSLNRTLDGISIYSCDLDHSDLFVESDLIVTQLHYTSAAIKLAKKYKKPLVHFVHNLDTMSKYNVYPEDCSLLVCNSYWLLEKINTIAPSIVVNPPCFDEDYKIESKTRTFTTILNLNSNKGGQFVADLAKSLPHIPFCLVRGAYPVEDQTVTMSKNITILPHTSDVKSIYANSKIVLVPSVKETWGKVGLEAITAGCGVIANSACVLPGLRECLGEGAFWAPRTFSGGKNEFLEWKNLIHKVFSNEQVYQELIDLGQKRLKEFQKLNLVQLEHLEVALYETISKKGKVHFFANEIHYLKHLAPGGSELEVEHRGVCVVPSNLASQASKEGFRVVKWGQDKYSLKSTFNAVYRDSHPDKCFGVCASGVDQKRITEMDLLPVRLEHGAGQTYVGSEETSDSYAGSSQHGLLWAYLAPGCFPYAAMCRNHPSLLRFKTGPGFLDRFPKIQIEKNCKVGYCFHWDDQSGGLIHRETWSYWLPYIDPVVSVITAHPRELHKIKRYFPDFTYVDTLEELHEQSYVVCGDNTSAVLIAAGLGHPIVYLNHPVNYRNAEKHGLRFNEIEDLGEQCWDPKELNQFILNAPEYQKTEWAKSALKYLWFRTENASWFEAAVYENLLKYKQITSVGKGKFCICLSSFDHNGLGETQKGSILFVYDHDYDSLYKAGLVRQLPCEYEEIMQNKKYLVVKERFEYDEVLYLPGDLIDMKSIPDEYFQFTNAFYPTHHKGVETK